MKPANKFGESFGTKWRIFWPPMLVFILLTALIQWLTSSGLVHDFVVPAPSAVWKVLTTQFDQLLPHVLATSNIALTGLVISIFLGVGMALVMDRFAWIQRATYPLIVMSQTVPTLVITPVIVLMFGYGSTPKLIVVVLVCFFPICISLYQGLRTVDLDQLRLLKTFGASSWQTMWQVKLPGSLPGLFSGLRISATYCVMAAALAEWSGGGQGLGIYMMRTKRSFTYDRMFAAIVLIVVLSLLVYLVVAWIEKLAMPWKTAENFNLTKNFERQ